MVKILFTTNKILFTTVNWKNTLNKNRSTPVKILFTENKILFTAVE